MKVAEEQQVRALEYTREGAREGTEGVRERVRDRMRKKGSFFHRACRGPVRLREREEELRWLKGSNSGEVRRWR